MKTEEDVKKRKKTWAGAKEYARLYGPSYREKNREKIREYYRLWYKKNGRNRPPGYEEVLLEWAQINPEKMAIHRQVRDAVRSGKIKRPESCSKCRKKRKVQTHHYDYKHYRHFIWVCASCHKIIHLGTKP